MPFSEKAISRIVTDIWTSMLGLEVKFIPEGVSLPPDEPSKVGYIQLTGDWEGTVTLFCPESLAYKATASMFEMPEDEVSHEEMHDALGELINMTAGNINAQLLKDSNISQPSVTAGNDRSVPGGKIARQLGFLCEGKPLLATVLEKERRERGRGIFELRKQGEFYLHIDGQPVGIREVCDHTPGGMGLLIDGLFTTGSEVSLRYQHDETDIEVSGSIAWCAPCGSGSQSRVGICLDAGNAVLNQKFFRAITVDVLEL
jgi:CheY-specific phosphatase CheX